jgi:hypothetical protein
MASPAQGSGLDLERLRKDLERALDQWTAASDSVDTLTTAGA